MLYEPFKNFISVVMAIILNYHDYIVQIWNDSENVYGSCKIFDSIYFVKVTQVFKQIVI